MATFPVRCFSCSKPFTKEKWENYEKGVKETGNPSKVLDDCGILKVCCRRMFRGHIPELEEYYTAYDPHMKFGNGKTTK